MNSPELPDPDKKYLRTYIESVRPMPPEIAPPVRNDWQYEMNNLGRNQYLRGKFRSYFTSLVVSCSDLVCDHFIQLVKSSKKLFKYAVQPISSRIGILSFAFGLGDALEGKNITHGILRFLIPTLIFGCVFGVLGGPFICLFS